jgi:hypothetical protein
MGCVESAEEACVDVMLAGETRDEHLAQVGQNNAPMRLRAAVKNLIRNQR